ncbi:hypothetical protein TMatcc_008010 [Talaromyces marneffei ATCC 18224]
MTRALTKCPVSLRGTTNGVNVLLSPGSRKTYEPSACYKVMRPEKFDNITPSIDFMPGRLENTNRSKVSIPTAASAIFRPRWISNS